MSNTNSTSIPIFDTLFPADSLEFCPHPASQNIFVCGTYKLDEPDSEAGDVSPAFEKQHRQGKCLVFEVTSAHQQECKQYEKIQEISLPAVLDMKWCHKTAVPVLAIGDSEGKVTLHEWNSDNKQLEHFGAIECASSDILCLSLDWSNRRAGEIQLGSLIVSLSNGSLCLLAPDNATCMSVSKSWAAHDYEPWIAAWNYWDTNVVFSGGDDLKMKGISYRQSQEELITCYSFDAGVTTIQSHPHIEHLLAVGSYNNTVYIFDTRKPLVPLTQVDVGGGAWRVKWHPSVHRQHDLLVASMHDGFKIVNFDLQDDAQASSGSVIKRFDAHESLAYGVDWSFASSNSAETLVGSCSFYDHVIHLWSG